MGIEEIEITLHAIERYGLRKYGKVDYHLGKSQQLKEELREELKTAAKTDTPPKVLFRRRTAVGGSKRGKRRVGSRKKKEARKIREIWENKNWYFAISKQGLQTVIKREEAVEEKIKRRLGEAI